MLNRPISDTVFQPEQIDALSQSAHRKCLNYLLGLDFGKDKEQNKIQELLRNWKWKLDCHMFTPKPSVSPPTMSFMVTIEQNKKIYFLRPALSKTGKSFKSDLQSLLSEEEIYALCVTWVKRNMDYLTDILCDHIEKWTLEEERNPDFTEWGITGKHLEESQYGLRLLLGITPWQIWKILQL